MRSFFKAGNIKLRSNNTAYLEVSRLSDLKTVIIPHFDKYPLLTHKRADFELFKMAIELIINKEHLTEEGLNKIASLKASMNKGLSDSLKDSFSDITVSQRPLVEQEKNFDPNWLAGFTSGEGCFFVDMYKAKTKSGYITRLKFILTQHSRDIELMRSLVNYLGCGVIYADSKKPIVNITVSKLEDINNKIIPLLASSLQGNKVLDFVDFCKVADLMKNKIHLTEEGVDQIRKIKAGMNRGRYLG